MPLIDSNYMRKQRSSNPVKANLITCKCMYNLTLQCFNLSIETIKLLDKKRKNYKGFTVDGYCGQLGLMTWMIHKVLFPFPSRLDIEFGFD